MCVSRNNLVALAEFVWSSALCRLWLAREREYTALSPNLISIFTPGELGHALFAPYSPDTASLLDCAPLSFSRPLCPPAMKELLYRSHIRRNSFPDRYSHPAANVDVKSRLGLLPRYKSSDQRLFPSLLQKKKDKSITVCWISSCVFWILITIKLIFSTTLIALVIFWTSLNQMI